MRGSRVQVPVVSYMNCGGDRCKKNTKSRGDHDGIPDGFRGVGVILQFRIKIG